MPACGLVAVPLDLVPERLLALLCVQIVAGARNAILTVIGIGSRDAGKDCNSCDSGADHCAHYHLLFFSNRFFGLIVIHFQTTTGGPVLFADVIQIFIGIGPPPLMS
jgi:hypothetical protein